MTLKENKEINSYIEAKQVRVVAYLLAELTPNSAKIYHEYCPFVEVRNFNYSRYPEYFKNLKEYRWKPLIVTQQLEEHDVVLWFDTSVVFGNGRETFKVKP